MPTASTTSQDGAIPSPLTPSSDFIVVGRISGLFGTRGWLKVFSYTRPRDNLLQHNPWYVHRDGVWCRYAVREARRHRGGVIAQLDGVFDRDHAGLLLRHDVAIGRTQLAATVADEYYWSDLIGLRVFNLQHEDLGCIAGLIETGANDVLRVAGSVERLIPFVRHVYVLDIDLGRKEMRVDWHSND